MQTKAKITAGLGGTLAVVAGIVFGNDPEELQKRSCFITAGNLWSCDQLAEKQTGPTTHQVSALSALSTESAPGGVAQAEDVRETPPQATTTRPQIALEALSEVDAGRSSSSVVVYVRARVTNPGEKPILVAWENIRRGSRISLAGVGEFEPSNATRHKPTGVVECRSAAAVCWERYRGEFTRIAPGESAASAITYRRDFENSKVARVVKSDTISFIGALVYGDPDAAIPEVYSVNLDNQALQKSGA